MDRNIYDNDFEEFLKQKSDQYKMYPSDRVWNNVYSSLHSRKKMVGTRFYFTSFLGSGLLVGKEVLFSNYSRMATRLNQGTETLTAANNNSSENNTKLSAGQTYSNCFKTYSKRWQPFIIQSRKYQ